MFFDFFFTARRNVFTRCEARASLASSATVLAWLIVRSNVYNQSPINSYTFCKKNNTNTFILTNISKIYHTHNRTTTIKTHKQHYIYTFSDSINNTVPSLNINFNCLFFSNDTLHNSLILCCALANANCLMVWSRFGSFEYSSKIFLFFFKKLHFKIHYWQMV